MSLRLALLIPVSLVLIALPADATPLPKAPIREEVRIGDRPGLIACQPSASEKDLGLPFYPKAKVAGSRLDRVTQDGKQVSLLAKAKLVTSDKLAVIAAFYRKKLTGQPKPEKKLVGKTEVVTFVVGSKADLRQVKITSDKGSKTREITLTRAMKPVVKEKPERPKVHPGEGGESVEV